MLLVKCRVRHMDRYGGVIESGRTGERSVWLTVTRDRRGLELGHCLHPGGLPVFQRVQLMLRDLTENKLYLSSL